MYMNWLLGQLVGQLLSETVHLLELSGQSNFRGLCSLRTGRYTTVYCSVQLIDLVSTLRYHAVIASLNRMEKFPVHPTGCKILKVECDVSFCNQVVFRLFFLDRTGPGGKKISVFMCVVRLAAPSPEQRKALFPKQNTPHVQ